MTFSSLTDQLLTASFCLLFSLPSTAPESPPAPQHHGMSFPTAPAYPSGSPSTRSPRQHDGYNWEATEYDLGLPYRLAAYDERIHTLAVSRPGVAGPIVTLSAGGGVALIGFAVMLLGTLDTMGRQATDRRHVGGRGQ